MPKTIAASADVCKFSNSFILENLINPALAAIKNKNRDKAMPLFKSCPAATTNTLWAAALLAAGSMLAVPAVAQPSAPQLSANFAACMDQSGGVTTEMHACISAEHTRQDQQLNRNYQALMAELTPARKKQLQTAQRLWLQYRDANCHFTPTPMAALWQALPLQTVCCR